MQGKREQCGAIFTDLRHTAPRKLPMDSHELTFFAPCSTVCMVNARAAAKPSRFSLRPSPPDVSLPFLSFV